MEVRRAQGMDPALRQDDPEVRTTSGDLREHEVGVLASSEPVIGAAPCIGLEEARVLTDRYVAGIEEVSESGPERDAQVE